MSSSESHLIGTQLFHVRTGDVASARRLMDGVGELWKSRMATVADQIFSAHIPGGTRRRLDRIELSIHLSSADNIDEELPVRFGEALAEALGKLPGEGEESVTAAGPSRSLLDLIEHLLLRGYLPWWARTEADIDAAAALSRSLLERPEAIAALVRRVGRHAVARTRLIHWLDDPQLYALIRTLVPAVAEFVIRYAEDLQQRQEESPFVNATRAEFRQAKWEVILAYLLADRGSHFNLKAFVRQTLRELAAKYGVNYAVLLQELVGAAHEVTRVWRESSLPRLLEEISVEDGVADRLQEDEPSASPEDLGELVAAQVADALRSLVAIAEDSRAQTSDPFRSSWADEHWTKLNPIGRAEVIARASMLLGQERLAALVARAHSASVRLDMEGYLRREDTRAADLWLRLAQGETIRPEDRDYLAAQNALERRRERASWTPPDAAATPSADRTLERLGERSHAEPEEATKPAIAADETVHMLSGGRENQEAPSKAYPSERLDEMVRRYLEKGGLDPAEWRLAWQEGDWGTSDRAPAAWLGLVLATYGEALLPRLRRWARAGQLSEALPEHFTDETLGEILSTIQPDQAGEVQALVTTAARVVPSSGFDDPRRSRQATWTVVWEFLLVDHGSVFNRRSFLSYTIRKLGPKYGMSATEFIRRLQEAASALGRGDLISDLRALSTGATADQALSDEATDQASKVVRDNVWAPPRSAPAAMALLRRWLQGEVPRQEADSASLRSLWAALRAPGMAAIAAKFLAEDEGNAAPAVDTLLAAGGGSFLGEVLFQGRRSQQVAWNRALEGELAELAIAGYPGGAAGFRVAAWQALLAEWRRQGGRALPDVAGWFARWLPTAFGRSTGASPDAERHAEFVKAREDPPLPRVPADDPIQISNAGLVLVAPFLGELFRRAQLLEGAKFAGFEATQIAVHLTQYLVTGGGRVQEHSLVLNKILCGLNPEDAVVPRIELSHSLTTMADGLLTSLAQRWPRGAALSLEGLRTTYLRRAGRLRWKKDVGWTIKVETKGFDVLLAELPWAFGRIQPAWMPKPLQVEWI